MFQAHTETSSSLFSWRKESHIFSSWELSFGTIVFPFLLGHEVQGRFRPLLVTCPTICSPCPRTVRAVCVGFFLWSQSKLFNCDSTTFLLILDHRNVELGVACSCSCKFYFSDLEENLSLSSALSGVCHLCWWGVTAEEMWVIQAHGASKMGQLSLGLKGRAKGPGVQESRDMARAALESRVGSTPSGAEPALCLPSH